MERALARVLRVVGLGRPAVRRRLLDLMPLGERWSLYDVEALTEILCPPGPDDTPVVSFSSRSERWVVVTRVLAAYAQERPLVLWLDDVQWGSETLEMVRWWYGTESLAHIPVLFLMTVRVGERCVPIDIYRAIDAVLDESGGTRLCLEPLTSEEHVELVSALLGMEPELTARLAAQTNGDPLFAVQLVGDWVERGMLRATDSGFELMDGAIADWPESIHSLWMRRMRRVVEHFSEAEAQGVELAALLGEQVEWDEWREACAQYGAVASDTLIAYLVDHGLVIPMLDGWRFAHDMLRERVEEDLTSSGRRAGMHAAIAELLGRRERPRDPRGLVRRGYHLEKAGAFEPAIRVLKRACDVAEEMSEYRLAERALDRMQGLLSLSRARPGDACWGWLDVARARIRARRAEFAEAEALLDKALRRAREHGWRDVEAAALEWSGFVARQLSTLPEAERLFEAAHRAYVELGDIVGQARALRGAGWVSILQGRVDRAHDEIGRALALFEQVEDAYGVASSLRGLGDVERLRARHERAGDYFARAAEAFEAIGSRHGVSECIHGQAEVLRYLGQLDDAAAGYRKSIAIDESVGARVPTIPRLNLGLVELARGLYAEAQPELAFAYERFVAAGQLGYAGCAAVCLLPCDADAEQWADWDAHYDFAREQLSRTGLVDPDVAGPAMIAADVALQAGQAARARAALSLSLEQWEALGNDARAAEVRERMEALGDDA